MLRPEPKTSRPGGYNIFPALSTALEANAVASFRPNYLGVVNLTVIFTIP